MLKQYPNRINKFKDYYFSQKYGILSSDVFAVPLQPPSKIPAVLITHLLFFCNIGQLLFMSNQQTTDNSW